MQAAVKAAEEEAREAGLEGKDAFAELKALSANGAAHDPREDLERLYRHATHCTCNVPLSMRCAGLVRAPFHPSSHVYTHTSEFEHWHIFRPCCKTGVRSA